MKRRSSILYKKGYHKPQIAAMHCDLSMALLVASNEGLDYEDLFAPNLNINEEMPINPMSLFNEETFTQLP